jgi:hypothetical protein
VAVEAGARAANAPAGRSRRRSPDAAYPDVSPRDARCARMGCDEAPIVASRHIRHSGSGRAPFGMTGLQRTPFEPS